MIATSTGRILGTLVAAGLAIWRALASAPEALWRDWVLLLILFTIYLSWDPDDRRRRTATLGLMAYLLGVYVSGVTPRLLSVFAGGG